MSAAPKTLDAGIGRAQSKGHTTTFRIWSGTSATAPHVPKPTAVRPIRNAQRALAAVPNSTITSRVTPTSHVPPNNARRVIAAIPTKSASRTVAYQSPSTTAVVLPSHCCASRNFARSASAVTRTLTAHRTRRVRLAQPIKFPIRQRPSATGRRAKIPSVAPTTRIAWISRATPIII